MPHWNLTKKFPRTIFHFTFVIRLLSFLRFLGSRYLDMSWYLVFCSRKDAVAGFTSTSAICIPLVHGTQRVPERLSAVCSHRDRESRSGSRERHRFIRDFFPGNNRKLARNVQRPNRCETRGMIGHLYTPFTYAASSMVVIAPRCFIPLYFNAVVTHTGAYPRYFLPPMSFPGGAAGGRFREQVTKLFFSIKWEST